MNKINMKHIHSQSDDDLWLAFQYVHGEISPDDVEAFEQRLLRDVALCDSVAKASLLTSAIATSEASVQPVQRHVPSDRGLSRATAVVSSLCCCVGLILVLSQPALFRSSEVGDSAPIMDTDLLVTVWADSGDSIEHPEELDFVVPEDEDLNIPDWMLAGISEFGMNKATESDTPQPNNDNPELL